MTDAAPLTEDTDGAAMRLRTPGRFRIVNRIGIVTLLIAAIGALGFWPSAALRSGRSNFGPSPSTKYRPSPIASGTVRMSENRMAASSGKRSSGCSVTSQATSGFFAMPRKLPARARVARYSGR